MINFRIFRTKRADFLFAQQQGQQSAVLKYVRGCLPHV